MAEERLIDDDLNKDKKYRIRKNADGEDELYIDESAEETFDIPALEFSAPESAEEPAPQESAEQTALREGEEQEPVAIGGAYFKSVEEAKALINGGEYEAALKKIDEAQAEDPYEGTAWALKLVALTCGFTDFSAADSLVETAQGIQKYCTAEQKAELAGQGEPIKKAMYALEERAAALHVEVESKKQERREVFLADRKRAVVWFSATFVPFLVCLVVALAFTSVMFARKDGLNMIIMIVFAGLAALFFIASLFTGHKLWAAMKKVSLNEQNSSTKLGREYEETRAEAEKLNTVLQSFEI